MFNLANLITNIIFLPMAVTGGAGEPPQLAPALPPHTEEPAQILVPAVEATYGLPQQCDSAISHYYEHIDADSNVLIGYCESGETVETNLEVAHLGDCSVHVYHGADVVRIPICSASSPTPTVGLENCEGREFGLTERYEQSDETLRIDWCDAGQVVYRDIQIDADVSGLTDLYLNVPNLDKPVYLSMENRNFEVFEDGSNEDGCLMPALGCTPGAEAQG